MERMGVPALVREDRVLPWVQEDELLTTGERGDRDGVLTMGGKGQGPHHGCLLWVIHMTSDLTI